MLQNNSRHLLEVSCSRLLSTCLLQNFLRREQEFSVRLIVSAIES